MKAVILLVKKIFQKNWRTLFLGVLAMGLLLGCFIAVFISAESLETTMVEKQMGMYGTQHAVILNAYPTQIQSSSPIKHVGYFQVYGLYARKTEGYQPIALGTADDNAIALNRLQLTQGRWPETASEVVVEKWVLADLNLPAETNMRLRLQYYALGENGSFSVEKSVDFTIVGILENYANIHVNLEQTQDGFEQLPNIISGSTDEVALTHITLSLESQTDAYTDNQLIYKWLDRNKISYSELVQNRNIYEQYYQNSVENITTSTTVAVFSGILVICGLLLAGAFLYLWVILRQKKQYLLEQLGMEKRDLFFYYFLQLFGLSVLSIPIGLVLGYLCYAFLSTMLVYIFDIGYTTKFSFASILAGVGIYLVLVLLTSLCIACFPLRKKKTKQKDFRGLRRRIRTKSPYLLLAYKDARVNYKQYFVIVVSICLCFFMLTAGSLLIWEAERTVKILQNDYAVRYSNYTYATSLMIPIDMQKGFRDADLKNIVTEETVQEALLLKRCDMNWIAGENTTVLEEIYTHSKCRPSFSTEEAAVAFQEEKNKYGYQEEETLYCAELLGVTNEMFDTFSSFVVIGDLQQKRIANGEGIVLCINEESYRKSYQQLLGSEIHFTQIVGFNSQENASGTRKDFLMKVLAIVVIPENNMYYSEVFKGNMNFVVCNDTFDTMGLDVPYQEMYLRLYDSEKTGNIEDYLAVLSANTGCNVQSRIQINAELQKQKNMVTLATGSIVLIIVCVVFVVLLLQYFVKAQQKKDLYQRLHVIGMTKTEISLLLVMDYILCVLLAVTMTFPALTVFVVCTYLTTPYLLSISSLLMVNGAFLFFLLLAGGIIFLRIHWWLKTLIRG